MYIHSRSPLHINSFYFDWYVSINYIRNKNMKTRQTSFKKCSLKLVCFWIGLFRIFWNHCLLYTTKQPVSMLSFVFPFYLLCANILTKLPKIVRIYFFFNLPQSLLYKQSTWIRKKQTDKQQQPKTDICYTYISIFWLLWSKEI